MFCCRPTCGSGGTSGNNGRIVIIERGPRGPRGYTGATGAQGPQGPQGPTGATGASGTNGLASYGGLYSLSATTLALTSTATPLTLSGQMPLSNVTYGSDSVTVSNGGVYEVVYRLSGSTSADTTLTLSVGQNGTSLPSTVVTRDFVSGTPREVGGSVFVTLTAGDTVTLLVAVTTDVTFTPSAGVNSTLTLKQLSQ